MVLRSKAQKLFAITVGVVGLALIIVPGRSAYADTTPTSTTLAGHFTATDQATFTENSSGNSTNITALTVTSGTPTQVSYFIDGSQVSNQGIDAKNMIGSNILAYDVTSLANGVHHVTGTISDDSGNSAALTTLDGSSTSLTFTVNSAASAAAAAQKACTTKQAAITTITSRITARVQAQVTTVEGAVKALQTYYTGQPKKLSQYDQLTTKLASDDTATKNVVTALVSTSKIDCTTDLTAQVNAFKNDVTGAQSKLQAYILDTRSMISALESL